ncbi:hypothetical protein DEJ24_04915 [Curtobacterium sp. MCPF17_001]|uniref:hypothetical protein n=1 Tax=Curtobacterium sp. MCPF17_001 TaxID=2175651 RepID=UPI000DA7556E|nr:hypothetical protein [Curtobacterium sp. MCPF17_001]PZE61600.1 hypothetical protein DEJ24_04915 [Curtobacterium sp. MCPF17_001]
MSNGSHSTTTTTRAIGMLTIAAALVAATTGCAMIRQQTADAWSVTYQVTTDAPAGTALTDVSVRGAERRGDAPTAHRYPQVTTTALSAGTAGSRWQQKAIVLTGDRARVAVTPPPETTATCRVLLDGKRAIAERQGQPGRPVTCSVTTPPFPG